MEKWQYTVHYILMLYLKKTDLGHSRKGLLLIIFWQRGLLFNFLLNYGWKCAKFL